jgi:hypothetical protein
MDKSNCEEISRNKRFLLNAGLFFLLMDLSSNIKSNNRAAACQRLLNSQAKTIGSVTWQNAVVGFISFIYPF